MYTLDIARLKMILTGIFITYTERTRRLQRGIFSHHSGICTADDRRIIFAVHGDG